MLVAFKVVKEEFSPHLFVFNVVVHHQGEVHLLDVSVNVVVADERENVSQWADWFSWLVIHTK